jgi:hypothetical protein
MAHHNGRDQTPKMKGKQRMATLGHQPKILLPEGNDNEVGTG